MTRQRLRLLDSAAEVYAIARYYAGQGDDQLLQRVSSRIERCGLTVAEVEARMHERAAALVGEWSGGETPR
jgi:hypothetical protein